MLQGEQQKTRSLTIQSEHNRARMSSMVRGLSKQRWFRVSPIFFLGTVVTAAGTTVYKNDPTIFVGMIIVGLGVVAMWIAETGNFGLKLLPGPVVFITGSVLTAMSMTINPSNPLLCSGMILTGLGTVVMWLISEGKWNGNAIMVAILFIIGITLEALSLTIIESSIMIMVGMIATGIGAFAMWAFDLTGEENEEKNGDEEKTAVKEIKS